MSERVFQPESKTTDYFLGEWQLCVRSNALIRGHNRIDLENRLVLLLVFFIENKGAVLDKERILKTIWPGKVVNEDSLAVAISHLRKALGDNSRAPRYIKTIPGVGYQLIADAGVITTEEKESHNSLNASENALPPSFSSPGSIGRWALVCIGLVLAIAIYGWNQHKNFPLAVATELSSPALAVDSLDASRAQWNDVRKKLAGSSADLKAAIKTSRDLLQQAPDFASAYAVIAEAKIKLLQEDLFLNDNCAEPLGLLQKSLELDAQQSRALVLRGNLLFWCKRDYAAAERDYHQAIALNPQDDIAPMQYAQLLLAQGKFTESLEQVEVSRRLNPLNYSAPTVVWIYQMQSRDDLALQELNRIDASDPGDRYFHISAQRVFARLGREQDSMRHWVWLMRDAQYTYAEIEAAQATFNADGLPAVSKWLLDRKDQTDLGQYTPPLSWARYAIAAGELEVALDFLEQAFERRQSPLLWAAVDPAYEPLRNHPRFQNLLGEIRKPAAAD